jgi:hypothetical protein
MNKLNENLRLGLADRAHDSLGAAASWTEPFRSIAWTLIGLTWMGKKFAGKRRS